MNDTPPCPHATPEWAVKAADDAVRAFANWESNALTPPLSQLKKTIAAIIARHYENRDHKPSA